MNFYRQIRQIYILLTGLAASLLLLGGCTLLPTDHARLQVAEPNLPSRAMVPVTSSVRTFQTDRQSCSGQFVTHILDHITMAPGGETIQMFEANGGGVAINDLDGDGWLDIVLANHRDPNTILWNQGLDSSGVVTFETERIGNGDARAANIVDVDGDGLLDIVFSRRVSAPNFWRNMGNRDFEKAILPGVSKPLYAINWGDLDQDGDLDLAGGTYDAGLLAEFGQEFLNSSEAGVYVYMQNDGAFQGKPLALNAQALAFALVDLNDDQRLDILVGNDFGIPDYGWLNTISGAVTPKIISWQRLALEVMSHSTMSYAAGDVDNNGRFELFSTDMMPYADDPQTKAAWAPVMAGMVDEEHAEDDPQVMANVLRSSFVGTTSEPPDEPATDLATGLGVNASGWSWSGKFGDLDQDGFLDLYIVNGMIEATTFAHLPNHELEEENQAFRNAGGERFVLAPEWSLNSTESGRGMSMADLDNDGDLDIVVNNLRGPSQLFENQLCGGNSVVVELMWPNSGNTRGVGSLVTMHTTAGMMQRQVEVASGYLSGDPAQIHFGLAENTSVIRLEILWPDGGLSVVDEIEPGRSVEIERQN